MSGLALDVTQGGDQPWESRDGGGGKEAKRAEIESAMDAIIASSFLPSPPRAYLVASMTHRIEAAPGGGGGHIRHAGSVDRPFLLCQLLLILIPSFSWGGSERGPATLQKRQRRRRHNASRSLARSRRDRDVK